MKYISGIRVYSYMQVSRFDTSVSTLYPELHYGRLRSNLRMYVLPLPLSHYVGVYLEQVRNNRLNYPHPQ
jgi:hypothetical protein